MAMNNSLAEVRPELVSEWSEKNLPLKPDEITFGSNHHEKTGTKFSVIKTLTERKQLQKQSQ